MRSPGIAFADIVLLWIAILATIVAFGRVSSLAATLLVPYLAWVSFATALNWSIWRMNP
jgi:tryptophan-rich sensory protein